MLIASFLINISDSISRMLLLLKSKITFFVTITVKDDISKSYDRSDGIALLVYDADSYDSTKSQDCDQTGYQKRTVR